MARSLDRELIAQLIVVFIIAWLVINAFEFLRADLAAGTLRPETGGILLGIIVIAVVYWWLARARTRE